MLTKEDVSLIKRYAFFEAVADRALVMGPLAFVFADMLWLIDFAVFGNDFDFGLSVGVIALAVIELVFIVIGVCAWKTNPTNGSITKEWATLVDKVIPQSERKDRFRYEDSWKLSSTGAVDWSEDSFDHDANDIDDLLDKADYDDLDLLPGHVAQRTGVRLDTKKYKMLATLLPIIILLGVFVPEYAGYVHVHIPSRIEIAAKDSKTSAATSIESIKAALEPICSTVVADDPLESPSQSYTVTGYLGSSSNLTLDDFVDIHIDMQGTITSIEYSYVVDTKATPHENLKKCRKAFKTMRDALGSCAATYCNEGIPKVDLLPDELQETFLSCTYDDDSFYKMQTTDSGLLVRQHFVSGSTPEILVTVEDY